MTKLEMIAQILELKENDIIYIKQYLDDKIDKYILLNEDKEYFLIDYDENIFDECYVDIVDLQISLINEIMRENIDYFKIQND